MEAKQFIIGKISNQISRNSVAWCQPVDYADTLEEANAKAEALWQEMCEDFDDFLQGHEGEGFVMGETVMIHDGENVY